MVYESKHYVPFKVIEDTAYNRVVVRFIETGYTTTVRRSRLKDLSVMDPTRPSVLGVGYRGVGPWGQYSHKKEYSKWFQMLNRCYNPKYHARRPTYKGCSVVERWLCFQSFCEDLKHLLGYDLFVSGELCHLDKGLIVKDNKKYGPTTCQFIKPEQNVKGVHYNTLNRGG